MRPREDAKRLVVFLECSVMIGVLHHVPEKKKAIALTLID